MEKGIQYIWMKVTNDEYELPLAVADSSFELSKILGLSRNAVNEIVCRAKKRGGKCQYVCVKVPRE